MNGCIEVGGRVRRRLQAADTCTHMFQECGEHGLAGVAELAARRGLMKWDEFIPGGNDGDGGDGSD